MNEDAGVGAGFWRRGAAYSLDWIVVGFSYTVMARSFIAMLYPTANLMDRDYYLVFPSLHWICLIWVAWVYFAGMESSPLRGTIGKLALGLYVTDMNGQRISFGRATGRHFARILSAIPVGLGYVLAGFTARKQALHDIVAGCLILRK